MGFSAFATAGSTRGAAPGRHSTKKGAPNTAAATAPASAPFTASGMDDLAGSSIGSADEASAGDCIVNDAGSALTSRVALRTIEAASVVDEVAPSAALNSASVSKR